VGVLGGEPPVTALSRDLEDVSDSGLKQRWTFAGLKAQSLHRSSREKPSLAADGVCSLGAMMIEPKPQDLLGYDGENPSQRASKAEKAIGTLDRAGDTSKGGPSKVERINLSIQKPIPLNEVGMVTKEHVVEHPLQELPLWFISRKIMDEHHGREPSTQEIKSQFQSPEALGTIDHRSQR
jgi:hypothetical protein